MEYFPLHELLQSLKRSSLAFIGFKTDLLLENLDAHLFGQALDKVFLLIGTNDIVREMNQKLKRWPIWASYSGRFPATILWLRSVAVGPVNERNSTKGRFISDE